MYLPSRSKLFVELLFITILQFSSDGEDSETGKVLLRVFKDLESVPEMATGVRHFLRKVVRESNLARDEVASVRVKRGCKIVDGTLRDIIEASIAD